MLRVFAEADFEVEVAVFAAVKARQALAAQADLLAFADAFRDFDVQGFARVGHLSFKGQRRHVEAQAALAALVSGGEVDGQFGVLVFAPNGAGRARGAVLSGVAEGGEDVVKAEVAAAKGLAVAKAAVVIVVAAEAAVKARLLASGVGIGEQGVIFGALRWVFEGVVSLIDFAGFFVGIRIGADVRVILAHQFVIGLFDVGGAGVSGDAEGVVVVFWAHGVCG